MLGSFPHRYPLVARLRHESGRNPIYPGAAKIRQREAIRTISVVYFDI